MHWWRKRSCRGHLGLRRGYLFRNILYLSKLVDRIPDQGVLQCWFKGHSWVIRGWLEVKLLRNLLWPSNLVRKNLDQSVTHWRRQRQRSGVTGGGGQIAPQTSDREIFAEVSGKKRQGKNGKGVKKKENCKREGGKLEMEVGKVVKWGEDLFFFFFFFFFFTFENDGNLFWVYQNGNFLPGKNISRREKNRKSYFAPSEKHACYAPEATQESPGSTRVIDSKLLQLLFKLWIVLVNHVLHILVFIHEPY